MRQEKRKASNSNSLEEQKIKKNFFSLSITRGMKIEQQECFTILVQWLYIVT